VPGHLTTRCTGLPSAAGERGRWASPLYQPNGAEMPTKLLSSIIFATLAALTVLGATSSAYSQSVTPGCVNDRYGNVQCPPPGGSCLRDYLDEVRCSPADGGILLDRYKKAVCGPGQCVVNRMGDVVCSRVPKGSAALSRDGEAVCTEGCVGALAEACIIPSK
jgi:hypothetical protein